MAKVKIGGQEYETQPLKFKQLKKAFPLIQRQQELMKEAAARAAEAGVELDTDPIAGMETGIAIVAIALERGNPEMNAEKIEEEIDVNECLALQQVIVAIITESGFEVARPGEGSAAGGAQASPSTETSTD